MEPTPKNHFLALIRALWLVATVIETIYFIVGHIPGWFGWATDTFPEVNGGSLTLSTLWFGSLFIWGPTFGRRFGIGKVVIVSLIAVCLIAFAVGAMQAAFATP